MSDILQKIIATKKEEVAARKQQTAIAQLRGEAERAAPARGFAAHLQQRAQSRQAAVIAEIKKASPSKGVIRADFDPVAIAGSYARGGATCLSVLTDEQYFQGSDDYLRQVISTVDLPVLRKDFTIDEYQLYEARALGADCVLLIVAALDIMRLTVLNQVAQGLGLDVLIEVHNRSELQAALSLQPSMIGINNRNLKTFETSLKTTIDLLDDIPEGITVVTESGIHNRADVQQMLDHNVYGFLVGEAFMRAEDPGTELQVLFN